MKARTQRPHAATDVTTVPVELGDRSYDIVIGSGVLDETGPRLAELLGARRATVITNPTVGRLFLDRVHASLRAADIDVATIEIPDGEEHKNLAWVAFVYDRLVEAHTERSAPILALGGGVVGDLTGFAAATYQRGVPFVQLPTTLLAQVDSSVGGKTGVNLPAGKNLIGAFYQPRLVLSDLGALKTLPRREFLAGLVEVIKYGASLDADLFEEIDRHLDRILALDPPLLQQLVRRSCELKAMVVQRDEREADFRAVLNLGHTVGHAIESLTEYKQYLHGEAVAIGMAFAAKLSHARGHCTRDTVQRLVDLLKRAGLPTDIPRDLLGQSLALAVDADKKVAGGKVKFVCLEAIGRTRFEHLTGQEIAAVAAR